MSAPPPQLNKPSSWFTSSFKKHSYSPRGFYFQLSEKTTQVNPHTGVFFPGTQREISDPPAFLSDQLALAAKLAVSFSGCLHFTRAAFSSSRSIFREHSVESGLFWGFLNLYRNYSSRLSAKTLNPETVCVRRSLSAAASLSWFHSAGAICWIKSLRLSATRSEQSGRGRAPVPGENVEVGHGFLQSVTRTFLIKTTGPTVHVRALPPLGIYTPAPDNTHFLINTAPWLVLRPVRIKNESCDWLGPLMA